MVRISLRDLRRARVKEVTGELSALATACLDAASASTTGGCGRATAPPGGSAGASRARASAPSRWGSSARASSNFSSDVDLVYVYDRDGDTEGERAVTHFAYYAKLAELVTEAIAKPPRTASCSAWT